MRVLASDPRASMQTVALESGLGRATVYRHFPTRDVLAGAIYRQSLDDAEEAIRGASEGARDTHDALLRVTQALVRNGERYRMVVSRAGLDPAMREREEEVGVMLVELMERGQREGLLRRDLTPRWLTGTYSAILLHGIRRQDEFERGRGRSRPADRRHLDRGRPRVVAAALAAGVRRQQPQ